ncbi:MAG: L,D-transpeptidase family protein [Firmicutes bacterium]|nr:L,D-transpeptidase family protein [Bacillota bacterium]
MKKVRSAIFLLISAALLHFIINPAHHSKHDYISWENAQQLTFSQKNPYEIYIDLSEYRLYLFKDREIIKKYPVAGGKEKTPSPFGTWKIIHKGKWGNGFGGYWMGLNVPWGKYGIHGTSRPSSIGRSSSHGCIRMYNHHAEALWKIVPPGTPVIITKGTYSPFGLNPRTIVPGDRGTDVMHVQMILRKKGLYKWEIDGIYGDRMKAAIFAIQEQNGIPPHNEIDRQTLKALGVFRFE